MALLLLLLLLLLFWPQVPAARMRTCVILAALLSAAASAELASENRARRPPAAAAGFDYSSISLAPEHIPYFLYNNKEVTEQCRLDPLCPFQVRDLQHALFFFFSSQPDLSRHNSHRMLPDTSANARLPFSILGINNPPDPPDPPDSFDSILPC